MSEAAARVKADFFRGALPPRLCRAGGPTPSGSKKIDPYAGKGINNQAIMSFMPLSIKMFTSAPFVSYVVAQALQPAKSAPTWAHNAGTVGAMLLVNRDVARVYVVHIHEMRISFGFVSMFSGWFSREHGTAESECIYIAKTIVTCGIKAVKCVEEEEREREKYALAAVPRLREARDVTAATVVPRRQRGALAPRAKEVRVRLALAL